jgi:uncharacterized repeat protein (TIGR04052 family)
MIRRVIGRLTVAVVLAAATAQAQTGLDVNGQCVGDADGNGAVAINELVTAVNNALGGCPQRQISLQFKAMVGDQPFQCGTIYEGLGTTGTESVPSDFRFYVSNVRLVTPDGGEVPLQLDQDGVWQYQDVALLDFEDGTGPCANLGNPAMNSTVRGTVPPGKYTGVRFTLGVPSELNHLNVSLANSPLNFTGLFWSWVGGYKFIRVDSVNLDGDPFVFHLGSTMCTGMPPVTPASCARPNRPEVEMADFDPDTDVILADWAALVADSDLTTNQTDTAPGCQSEPFDDDCRVMFRNIGLDFDTGMPTPETQKFFRME